jgi:hypothetical protein
MESISQARITETYLSFGEVFYEVRSAARQRGHRPGNLLKPVPQGTFTVELSAIDLWRDLPTEITRGRHSDLAWQLCQNVVREYGRNAQ